MRSAAAIWEESSAGHEDGRARYHPPVDWRTLGVGELLAGTGRWTAGSKQLNLLDAGQPDRTYENLKVFIAGDETLLRRRCVSVIGTRQVSAEGAARARRLARDLVGNGIVVVSGLAEGVDTEAMSSAILNRGNTIGVIGTPLDKAYPAKNAALQETVYRDHLLISQFPAGTHTYRSHFPQRNRLMATVSDATVVIEASDSSGTLHQAAECTRLGRWLFIARSVVDDVSLAWPRKFLSYERCVPLDRIDDIVNRIVG